MWVLLALVFTAHEILATPIAYFDTEAACLAAIDPAVGQSKDFGFDWYGMPAPICLMADKER
jgi:hypothetical protein